MRGPARWVLGVALLLTAVYQRPVVGQQAETAPWRTSHFPYLTLSPGDGLEGVFRVIHFRQAHFEDRISLRDAVAVEGGLSTRGSRRLQVRGDFPRIAPGWRLVAEAGVGRRLHMGDPERDEAWREHGGAVEVTRQVIGSVAVAVRGGVRHLDLRTDCVTAFGAYSGAPAVAGCDGAAPRLTETDHSARVALVVDRRDREFETREGLLLEIGGTTGRSVGTGYQGAHAMARGWLPVGERAGLTARVGARALSANASLTARQELVLWEQRIAAPAGPRAQRGLAAGEQAGRGVLLAGAELRREIWQTRGLAAVTVFAFVDGVRVFRDPSPLVDPVPGDPVDGGRLRLTGAGWDWSPGAGVAVRVLRSAQLNLTGAGHPRGGMTWYLSSGWAW